MQPMQPMQQDGPNEPEQPEYSNLLTILSEKWLYTKLTHQVSAAASKSFWKTAMECVPALYEAKKEVNVTKNTPGFIHQRRKLYKDMCPEVHLKYAFLNKENNQTEVIHSKTAPSKYNTSKYIKLYEEAHIKV